MSGAAPRVRIGGRDVVIGADPSVLGVRVIRPLDSAGTLEVAFGGAEAPAAAGDEVQLLLPAEGGLRPVFAGTVVRLDATFDRDEGSHRTLVARDPSHRLLRADRRRSGEVSGLEQLKAFADSAGLDLAAAVAGGPARDVVRVESDGAALRDLAASQGWSWFVEDGRLMVLPPGGAGATHELPPRPTLRRLWIEQNPRAEAGVATVRAWDRLSAQAWTARSSAGGGSLGDAEVQELRRPAASRQAVEARAAANARASERASLTGEVRMALDPRVRPGDHVVVGEELMPQSLVARVREVQHRLGDLNETLLRLEGVSS